MKLSKLILLLLFATAIVGFTAGCALLERAESPLPTAAVAATVPPTAVNSPTAAVAVLPTAEPTATVEPSPTPEPTTTVAPTVEPTPTVEPEPATPEPPAVVTYDLGEGVIIQDWFPEDSRFREMPVRLNGIIAAPDNPPQPAPVVVILHGTHPGCPLSADGMVDAWPCAPEDEQPNYSGFDYLVQHLAQQGYVALALNINAVNTFGFGEASGDQVGARLEQLVDHHLTALATAAAGGENNFGVELAGVADLSRLALVGHSRGGEYAVWLADRAGLNSPYATANFGYGPVRGILHLATAASTFEPRPAGVPQAIILPACDADVVTHDGQVYYEEVRLDPTAQDWFASAWLETANHNGFNSYLGADLFAQPERPDCETILDGEAQRDFTEQYATDFLTTIFGADPGEALAAAERLGMDVTAPAPDTLYGLPGRVAGLSAAADRLSLFTPLDESELTTNRLGGVVTAEGVQTTFCRAGFFLVQDNPGTEPCRRFETVVPGNPAFVVTSWEAPGATLRFALPDGSGDVSGYTTLSLRAVLDPLSPLNVPDTPQALSVQLTDASGATATVATRTDEPALQYPAGLIIEDLPTGPRFSGPLPLTTIRVPLAAFEGVDPTNVTEVALVFDQTQSGTLFLGDVEFVRPPHLIGAWSTLLENADGGNDALKGVARFDGASTCSGVLVDTGETADAPAYLLTNGHCAQDWDGNAVHQDVPAEGWSATFNYFVDTPDARITVPAARVAYSTMKGRDVAIIELAATVGELAEQGVMPFPIADALPDGNTWPMTVVGAPTQGVPGEIAYLRAEECLASGQTDLFEFIWRFDDAIRNACQDILGGSSGSPAFASENGDLVALINTTNIGAITPCGLGAPCEVTPAGTVFVTDRSYATPLVGLGACFTAGRFDLAAESCPLDDGRQLLVSGAPTQGVRPIITAPDGTQSPATWNVTLSGELPYYRYKTGPAGQTDCGLDEGYSAVTALAEAGRIDDPLPPEEGSYVLCVVAGESPEVDETWQAPAFATTARALIDTTPPTVEPRLSVLPFPDGGLVVEPIFAIAELVDFQVKLGPEATTDCAGDEGFVPYRRIPFRIAAEEVPARVCVIGFDYAGNASDVYEVVLGTP